MNQERRDYADNDLPPPQMWPTNALVIFVVLTVLGGFASFLLLWSVATGPSFDY